MNTPLKHPDVAELEEKIKRLKFALQSSDVKMYMGRFLKDIIYRRVKSGKGVTSEKSSSPSQQKLKALSKSYIAYRNGEMTFRRGRSGKAYPVFNKPQAILEVGKEVKSGKKGAHVKIKVSHYNSQSAFKKPDLGEFGAPARSNLTLSGQMLSSITEATTLDGFRIFIPNTARNGSKLTNAKVYEYVSKERPFFALTNGEFRILQNEFEKIVEQKIQVIFGK